MQHSSTFAEKWTNFQRPLRFIVNRQRKLPTHAPRASNHPCTHTHTHLPGIFIARARCPSNIQVALSVRFIDWFAERGVAYEHNLRAVDNQLGQLAFRSHPSQHRALPFIMNTAHLTFNLQTLPVIITSNPSSCHEQSQLAIAKGRLLREAESLSTETLASRRASLRPRLKPAGRRSRRASQRAGGPLRAPQGHRFRKLF